MRSAHLWSLVFGTLFGVWAGLGYAQTQDVEYRATGRGVSVQEAIENALFEVARQANGTQIQASQASSIETASGNVGSLDGEPDFRFEERTESKVKTSASGVVSGYEVLDQRTNGRGVEVDIVARVPRYRVPGIDSSNRRRLAVLPFGSMLGEVDFFGRQEGPVVADELSRAVLAQFVQSRRFEILDRESWGAIGAERSLIASPSTPLSEKAKLGMTLGADYLVLGELLEAGAGVEQKIQRLTGTKSEHASASIGIAYRIVVPATGEIKFADTLQLEVQDSQGRRLSSRTEALGELSKRLVGIALDRIYPMKVVSVASPDSVVLNQGGSTLSIGDRLRLTQEGESVVDPYTKEPLGKVETPVGLLQITRVDGKMAYAQVLEATGAVQPGLLARREIALYGAGNPSAVPPPTPRTEGVRLPFDR